MSAHRGKADLAIYARQVQLGHTVLNRTPLTAETNRVVVSDRLPNAYLPELIARTSRAQVEVIMASHFVSPSALNILLRNPFTSDDFEAFINKRQMTIVTAIDGVLLHDRLEIPIDLRTLDGRIERIELILRGIVVEASGGVASRLPPHLFEEADNRLARDLKKNPALDTGYLRILPGRLEYFDLREVQDALIGKNLWDGLAARFGSKESLIGRLTSFATFEITYAIVVTLGNPKLHVARSSAVSAVRAEADRYAANVLPVIREAQKAGATTLRDIAKALNARGVATARGGQWHAKSVSNILERA